MMLYKHQFELAVYERINQDIYTEDHGGILCGRSRVESQAECRHWDAPFISLAPSRESARRWRRTPENP